jgi:two-component system, sensor histidine kinase
MKIVILDEDEAAGVRTAQTLRSGSAEELTITHAETTEAALYALAQRSPDCLVISLPGEGSELLHTLHVTYASRLPCPTLVIGTPGLDTEVAAAFKAGAHEYCPKTASSEQLWAALESSNERYTTQLQEQERKELLEYFHQDLERKDQLKSSFVANASHELRTPVSALVGLVSLLQPRVHDEESQALLSTMKACCDGMLIVVDDLLDLTGLESGHIEIRQEPFALAPLVQRTVDSWLPVARDKGVRLTCSYHGDLPGAILGDPRRLSQVLFNTLGGALKFSRSAVDLEIRSTPDPSQGYCQVDCEVRVAGTELSDEERRALLDPFPDPSKGLDSAGLGLGVAYTLAQAMQGKLQCENLPGHGILFRFGFSSPLAETPAPPPAAPAQDPSEGPRYVLVAEDNPIVAHIISLQLRQLGFEPTVVTDGLQVVDKAQNGAYAAVIMDCQMPRMDGVEATRVLRRTFSAQQLPIVALTASGRAGQAELCLAAGMNDYLIKPATAEQLKQVLARHMPAARLTPQN